MGHDDVADLPVLEDVHRTPVRDTRDGQPRHVAQGGAVIERRREDRAGLRQEALALTRLVHLRDVLHDVDREHRVPALV